MTGELFASRLNQLEDQENETTTTGGRGFAWERRMLGREGRPEKGLECRGLLPNQG